MYKILLINTGGEHARNDLRQMPRQSPYTADGKYRFYINEPIEDPDFVFIRGKALKEKQTFHVAKENTVLLTSEPYSILSYPKGYCRQFGLVCSCQDQLKLPNVTYTQAILPWFIGIRFQDGKEDVTISYDDLKNQATTTKNKLISIITSDKAFTKGHQERLDFVVKLKKHYGERLDVFGRGHNGFADKWDVLAPYKYHIVIENSSSRFYWTEKISDCYLARTYPIYYGCPNLGDYFSEDTFTGIDIHDLDGAIKTIDSVIDSQLYENRREEIEKARTMVLEDYNMFNVIVSICEKLDPDKEKSDVAIIPAKSFFDWHNLYLHLLSRTGFKIKKKLRKYNPNTK